MLYYSFIILSYCALISPEVQQFVIKRAVNCMQYSVTVTEIRNLTSLSKF